MTESAPDSPQPAIAAAVITRNGKVLLVERRVKEGSLSWQFPAGAVEVGESASSAAVREAHEETGLVVRDVAVLGERIHPNTGRTMIYVACEFVSGNAEVADKDELVNFAWVDRRELSEYVPYGFYGPVQEYLDNAMSV